MRRGTAGDPRRNAQGDLEPAPFLRGPASRIPEPEPEIVVDARDPSEPSYPLAVTTDITLPAVVNGQIMPCDPDMLWQRSDRFTPGYCGSLPLRGPQGTAISHRRQCPATHSVPGRRRSGLPFPGHVGVCTTRQGRERWPTTTTTDSIPIPCCSSRFRRTDSTWSRSRTRSIAAARTLSSNTCYVLYFVQLRIAQVDARRPGNHRQGRRSLGL